MGSDPFFPLGATAQNFPNKKQIAMHKKRPNSSLCSITPMDYLKTIVPSQLIAKRGSNIVAINPGSANVRIGFAHQQVPFIVPHCIARLVKGLNEGPKKTVQDRMGRVADYTPYPSRSDTTFTWTNVMEKSFRSSSAYCNQEVIRFVCRGKVKRVPLSALVSNDCFQRLQWWTVISEKGLISYRVTEQEL